jgi:hypothetical protein
LAGWRIEVDLNSDGSVEHAALTDANGDYAFDDVGLGDLKGARTFSIREVPQDGFVQTFPLDSEPIPFFSDLIAVIDFGNFKVMEIGGKKFEDKNGNGAQDTGEPALAGWRIELDLHGDGTADDFRITDESGNYVFKDVGPGDFDKQRLIKVREVLQSDWMRTFPESDPTISIRSGLSASADFGNFHMPDACGRKFNDVNANGAKDAGEPGLKGWTIELVEPGDNIRKTVTQDDGSFFFENLLPGAHQVREVAQAGWSQTFPAKGAAHSLTSESGKDILNLDFGNYAPPGESILCGVVYHDLDGDGTRDAGEPGLGGWSMELISGVDIIQTTRSLGSGSYCFAKVRPGVYKIREILPPGWEQTFPADSGIHEVVAISDQNRDDLHFGIFRPVAHVVSDGSCGGYLPCHTAIGYAIGAALEGAVIRVAGGTYDENVIIGRQVTLELCWDPDFTTLDQSSAVVLTGP